MVREDVAVSAASVISPQPGLRLRDLIPRLLKVDSPSKWHEVQEVAGADGVSFLCPKCFRANKGPVGTHSVVCWRPGVSPDLRPGPGRWLLVGASLDSLSLVASSRSVRLEGGCRAHFYVKNGEVTFA